MKKKHCALKNKSGFTLAETIVTMMIFCLILSFMPLMYQTHAAIDRTISTGKDFEWNMFLIQFRKELYSAENWRIGLNERIFLMKNGIPVTYERYGKVIRRQVRDAGHEIVLQNVNKLSFSKADPTLYMVVEFEDGSTEEASFFLPPDQGGMKDEK
jgi:competence protein ComGF